MEVCAQVTFVHRDRLKILKVTMRFFTQRYADDRPVINVKSDKKGEVSTYSLKDPTQVSIFISYLNDTGFMVKNM